MEGEIFAQATGCQEFVQGLLLIALVSAPVQPKEATRPKGVGVEKGDGGEATGAAPTEAPEGMVFKKNKKP